MGNDPRQQSDSKNRSVGLLALVTGAVVAALAWRWLTPSGYHDVEAGLWGRIMVVLGLALLITAPRFDLIA